jgi:hypothetical protein
MPLAATLLTALAAGMLQTTEPSEPPPEEVQGDVTPVEVTGIRPRGSVTVDVDPELVLGEEDLKALGGNTVGELVEQLGSMTATGRGGQPIVLINGRRISGPQEWRNIPRAAVERTEVLPEQVAQAYGYPVDQKVLNFVLKPAFQQTSVRAEGTVPTQGGAEKGKVGGSYFRVHKGDRWSLDIEVEGQNPLFETERDIVRDPGSRPFDLTGNITGRPYGGEIDPALSGLAGQTVLVAAVPEGNATPGLADFVAGAGMPRTDDLSAWRSRVSELETAKIDGSVAHDIDHKTKVTLSASLQDRSTRSWLGLPGVTLVLPSTNPYSPFANDVQLFRFVDAPRTMIRTNDSLTTSAGVVFDGYLVGDWRWTLSGDYNRVDSESRTGTGYSSAAFQSQLNAGAPGANPFGDLTGVLTRKPDDTANSVSSTGSAELMVAGDLFDLPTGPLDATFTVGWDTRSLDSESVRNGLRTDRSLSRDRTYGKLDLWARLVNRDEGPLGGVGNLSAGFDVEYYEASDFGGLMNFTANSNWSPFEGLNFNLSYSHDRTAPELGLLNDPIVSTPNTPVFDFATGQTVLVNYVTGGNPALEADTRQTTRLSLRYKPFKAREMTFLVSYVANRVDDAISVFPSITPEIEAALPGRFTRDGTGQLIALDARALNYSRTERQDLRFFFFYNFPIGKPDAAPAGRGGAGRPGGPGGGPRGPGGPGGGPRFPGGSGGMGPGGPGMSGGFGGGGMGGGGFGGPPGQARAFLHLNYQHRLQDEIVIRPGLPVIDQLKSGRQPRDQVDGFARLAKDGNSAGLSFTWRGESRIDGGAGGTDLTFEPYAIINLDFTADLSSQPDLMKAAPWLKGVELQLNFANIFDERQNVISSTGSRPLNYQPDYLDPYGRTVTFKIRKVL